MLEKIWKCRPKTIKEQEKRADRGKMKILLEIVENRRLTAGAETLAIDKIGCADYTVTGMTMRAECTSTGITKKEHR